ncbi:MAG: serine hydrolase [Pseudonocardia sp.]
MRARTRRRGAQLLVVALATAGLLAVPIVTATGDRAIAPTLRGDGAGPGPVPAQSFAGPDAGPNVMAVPAPARTGLPKAAVTAAERAAGGATEIAIVVLDRETGEMAVGARGDVPVYTASLSKVVLAVDIVDRRRLDGLAVSAGEIDLLRRALSASDDGAMNELWGRFDGPGAASRVSRRVGLTATSMPGNPSQWGQMSVPATDTVRIWEYILEDLPAADRNLLISAMNAAPARAKDGFDQAFGLLAPDVDGPGGPGSVVKQGWMCCPTGHRYLHSAGTVGSEQRFVVALLTETPRRASWESVRAEVTAIADATVRALNLKGAALDGR